MTTPHPLPWQTTPPSGSASSLPTARQFLTSLFNAISEIPLAGGRNLNPDESSDSEGDDLPLGGGGGGEEDEQELNKRRRKMPSRRQRRLLLVQDDGAAGRVKGVGSLGTGAASGAGNVLKQVPISHRHLIITLHVLFPGLVLPALDLLDRGLVGHISLREKAAIVKKEEKRMTIKSEQARQEPSLLGEGNTMFQPNIKAEEDGKDGDSNEGIVQPPGGKQKEAEKGKEKRAAAFYLVRSSQPTSHHHRRRRQQRYGYDSVGGGEEDYPAENSNNTNNLFPGGQRAYIVRLDAWNCTCAAFAFASFLDPSVGDDTTTTTARVGEGRASSPGARTRNPAAVNQEMDNVNVNNSSTTGQSFGNQEEGNQEYADDKMDIDPPPLPQAREEMSETLPNTAPATETAPAISGAKDDGEDEQGWSFGGMSLSHKHSDDDSPPPPPLCKHLLACLLAERWKDALGRYVVERQVSKEAMAGIVAEI